jgi:hypothetical protein
MFTWLDAGVAPPQVAGWAGHSGDVLLLVYARCIAGQQDEAKRRILEARQPTRMAATGTQTARLNPAEADPKLGRVFGHSHPHKAASSRAHPPTKQEAPELHRRSSGQCR